MLTIHECKALTEANATHIEICNAMLKNRNFPDDDNAGKKAFEIAWEWGHSSGIYEVAMYFDDLADLVFCARQ